MQKEHFIHLKILTVHYMPTAKEIVVNKTNCLPSGAYTLQSGDQKKKKPSKIYKKMPYDTITPSVEKIKHRNRK